MNTLLDRWFLKILTGILLACFCGGHSLRTLDAFFFHLFSTKTDSPLLLITVSTLLVVIIMLIFLFWGQIVFWVQEGITFLFRRVIPLLQREKMDPSALVVLRSFLFVLTLSCVFSFIRLFSQQEPYESIDQIIQSLIISFGAASMAGTVILLIPFYTFLAIYDSLNRLLRVQAQPMRRQTIMRVITFMLTISILYGIAVLIDHYNPV